MRLKKLLVLDVNGLLIDTYYYKTPLPEALPDARVGNFYVYRRPFCNEFLQFCLENFIVGIWSSAREYNVNNLIDYVFGEAKDKLAFSWHQSFCTDVGLKAPDNESKPLFMKDLSKLWRREKVNLPWNEGDYGPSNTLLVDDTPYKAVLNPPNTAIFPRSYSVRDQGDNFLGGALRTYLEGIRDAANVQTYVENNPFGEPSITPENPLWSHVSKFLLGAQSVLNTVGNKFAQTLPIESVYDNRFQKARDTNVSKKLQTRDGILLCENFPSGAKDLHSSKNVVPVVEKLGQSEISNDFRVEQGNTCQRKQEKHIFSGVHKPDEQCENVQLKLAKNHVKFGNHHGDHKTNVQKFRSFQHEDEGTLEDAGEGFAKKGQAGAVEKMETDRTADAEIDGEHHVLLEEKINKIYPHRGRVHGNSCFSSSNSKRMQGENNRGRPPEKHQRIMQRADGAHELALNGFNGAHDQLLYSDYSRHKRRRFQREPPADRNQKNYYNRDNLNYSQLENRHNGWYRNDNNRGRYVNRQRWSYPCKYRDGPGYGHTAEGEKDLYSGLIIPPFHRNDQRKDFKDIQYPYHQTNVNYDNKDASLDAYAKESRRRHGDWQIDNSAEHFWGRNKRSPSKMAPDVNVFDQGKFNSNYQQRCGFDARMTYQGSNQGSSGHLVDKEVHGQSYRRGGGASRLSYQNNGASMQWYPAKRDGSRNRGTQRDYIGTRQH